MGILELAERALDAAREMVFARGEWKVSKTSAKRPNLHGLSPQTIEYLHDKWCDLDPDDAIDDAEEDLMYVPELIQIAHDALRSTEIAEGIDAASDVVQRDTKPEKPEPWEPIQDVATVHKCANDLAVLLAQHAPDAWADVSEGVISILGCVIPDECRTLEREYGIKLCKPKPFDFNGALLVLAGVVLELARRELGGPGPEGLTPERVVADGLARLGATGTQLNAAATVELVVKAVREASVR